VKKRNVAKQETAQTASKPTAQQAVKPQGRTRVEWKAKGLTEQRAQELRQEARDAVDEKLKARLETFKDRTRVTEEELESTVKECGEECPRAEDKRGTPIFEDVELKTTLGTVPWRAPLFTCKSCRRFCSPLTTVL